MKRLLTILMALLFVAAINAQPYSVTYNISIPIDCNNTTDVKLKSGTMMEGEEFEFPSPELPALFSFAQSYVSVFSGAILGLEEGSLNENVTFNVNLEPFKCSPENDDLLEMLNWTVEVVGEESGTHDPFTYYNFNEGKAAYLKFNAANLLGYIQTMGYTLEDVTAWFYSEGFTPDLTGVSISPYTLGDEYITFNFSHFSKIAIGKNLAATDVKLLDSKPIEFKLSQNYPNPFNPTTKINYSINKSGSVKITVYNSIGGEVATLVNEKQSAGNYEVTFDASNLPSGIYFYDLVSGDLKNTRKMILLK